MMMMMMTVMMHEFHARVANCGVVVGRTVPVVSNVIAFIEL